MQGFKYRLEDILANMNISSLNEMQQATVEAALEHNNLLLLSATGSGKTLAYLLPLLDKIESDTAGTSALIVVPSRELAIQIEQVFRQMGTGLKITSCYGGHRREIEENNLVQAPAIIVGTPGRLCDHIRRHSISTDTIKTLVLDEFDKSLELGFLEEVEFIVRSLPALQNRILTSATVAVEIPGFVGFDEHERLDFTTGAETPAEKLEVKFVTATGMDKRETLFRLLCTLGDRPAIVFCNHRDTVEDVSLTLKENGIINVFYHGGMEQYERDSALCKFRNGSAWVLVTTDLAARGLDIPHIRYIIHYHLPPTEEIYTHRNGRTARMNATGTAILVKGEEEYIPTYINGPIAEIKLPPDFTLPDKPKWVTLFISAGKKDKVNKIDIVGFLSKKGELKKEDIGLVDVKDFSSFAAIRRSKATHVMQRIKDEKIKNKRVKIYIAK